MAAFALTDVAVSIPANKRDIVPAGPKLVSMASITFGDGALTYATGGVPLPAISAFGYKREISNMIILPAVAAPYLYRYDAANHKIMILTVAVLTGLLEEIANGTAPAEVVLGLLMIGE